MTSEYCGISRVRGSTHYVNSWSIKAHRYSFKAHLLNQNKQRNIMDLLNVTHWFLFQISYYVNRNFKKYGNFLYFHLKDSFWSVRRTLISQFVRIHQFICQVINIKQVPFIVLCFWFLNIYKTFIRLNFYGYLEIDDNSNGLTDCVRLSGSSYHFTSVVKVRYVSNRSQVTLMYISTSRYYTIHTTYSYNK